MQISANYQLKNNTQYYFCNTQDNKNKHTRINFNGKFLTQKRIVTYENFVYKNFISKYMNYKSRKQLKSIRESIRPFIKKIQIPFDKNKIVAWELNPQNSKKYIIFLHGIKGHSTIPPNQIFIESILLHGKYGILVPEYRGTAELHKEKISIGSIIEDSKAAYKYLLSKGIKEEDITLVSHCLGTIPAVHIANDTKNLNSIIMLSPLADGNNIGAAILHKLHIKAPKCINNILNKFFSLFVPKDMNVQETLKRIKTPITVLVPEKDNVISVTQAKNLAKNINNLKQMIIIPQSGHHLNKTNSEAITGVL